MKDSILKTIVGKINSHDNINFQEDEILSETDETLQISRIEKNLEPISIS